MPAGTTSLVTRPSGPIPWRRGCYLPKSILVLDVGNMHAMTADDEEGVCFPIVKSKVVFLGINTHPCLFLFQMALLQQNEV